MHINLIEIGTASMVLFAVIDIIGSLPIVLEIKRKVGHIEAGKASAVAFGLMILFLFLGETILHIIGLDVSSFAIAGSIVIFFMSMEMILGVKLFRNESVETASIVPLAFPIIAGAGTMTSILSLRAEFEAINIVIAILINMLFVYLVLRNTARIEKLLGPIGAAIIRKVFGIILLAIAVKLFKSNLGI
ncbi:MAG: MarC family protein [Flavobacteriales bacterium]